MGGGEVGGGETKELAFSLSLLLSPFLPLFLPFEYTVGGHLQAGKRAFTEEPNWLAP